MHIFQVGWNSSCEQREVDHIGEDKEEEIKTGFEDLSRDWIKEAGLDGGGHDQFVYLSGCQRTEDIEGGCTSRFRELVGQNGGGGGKQRIEF